MERSWGDPETVRKMERVGACDAGTNRGAALTDGPSRADDRRAFGRHAGPLDSSANDSLNGGPQQPVLASEAQGLRISDIGTHDHHALSRLWETQRTVLQMHLGKRGSETHR